MDDSSTPKISGQLSLPQSTPGTLHQGESRVELDDGRIWAVRADTKTKLAMVLDEKGQVVGALEEAGKGIRQVVLPGGGKPPVLFKNKLFSRQVLIGDTAFKQVMMLEGNKRVFGDDRIRLEHRDFHNEVRFHCQPEFLVPAVLVAFEIYGRPMMDNGAAGA